MAPRSNWKGYLKLSLVSASIAIYPATSSSEKVKFNTLNRATGNRLKRKMVDAVRCGHGLLSGWSVRDPRATSRLQQTQRGKLVQLGCAAT
jgi:non-homologous end joining protein Ku